jgi:drug/metabolite transporter (DMT)-like permease
VDPSHVLSVSITLAVLGAAVTHAAWNAIAHGIRDQVLAFALIGAGALAAGVPLVCLAPVPRGACWPYLLGSVAIHVFYNLLLMRAYRYGEFSQVYPLARGLSPLVVTVLAAAFVGETPAVFQVLGVLVVSGGLAVLVFAGQRRATSGAGPGGSGQAGRRAALLAAAGTGVTIAAYTVVDGVGVRMSHSPAGYIGWLMVLMSLGVPLFALIRRRGVLREQSWRVLAAGVTAGALSTLAYGLVLWAQTRGALAPIAALRETSVIFGSITGTVVFKEPFGRSRIAATIVVAVGIIVLNLLCRRRYGPDQWLPGCCRI